MLNISKILFYSIMFWGTILTLSSETWLGMWMGLEMNLIAFIPILYESKKMNMPESCMIYFLIQSLGSILLLMTILNNSLIMISPLVIKELFKFLLVMSLMIKLGMPPFHFWFPEMLEKMKWLNCMILMTWQKVAPLTILSYTIEQMPYIPLIISLTCITGAIGGLNQTSIRKIMAYSSINHMGWMTACMKFNNQAWTTYLIIYSMMIIMMSLIFNYYSMMFINQMNINTPEMLDKSLIIILFMSLGGLPPFLGFLPKWLVINAMINSNSFTILMIMVMSTLITLFYYLRMISTSLLISFTSNKWYNPTQMNKNITLMMIFINLALPSMMIFSL